MKKITISNNKQLQKFFLDENYRENVNSIILSKFMMRHSDNILKYENESYKNIKAKKNIKINCYCHYNNIYYDDDNNCNCKYRFILDPYACKNIKYLENYEIDELKLVNCDNMTDIGNKKSLRKIIITSDTNDLSYITYEEKCHKFKKYKITKVINLIKKL